MSEVLDCNMTRQENKMWNSLMAHWVKAEVVTSVAMVAVLVYVRSLAHKLLHAMGMAKKEIKK